MTERTKKFEAIALPHLNSAFNLARWLVRDDHDAQDIVQEAYLRGLRYFDSFQGEDARPWLLGIVRNTCYTWLRARGQMPEIVEFDDDRDSVGADAPSGDPETLLMKKQEVGRINGALECLSTVFREVVVLRELEGLSYTEIATVTDVPVGTVMSRLSRARALLRVALGGKD
ncbi:MAG: sigma-70 family RNA polymerase sigma factor [Burkholderiales bacterium]